MHDLASLFPSPLLRGELLHRIQLPKIVPSKMHGQHSQNMPTSIHRNPYQMSDRLIFPLFPSSLLNPAQNDVLQYQGQTIPSPFLPANISSPSSRLLSLALARSAVRPPAPLPLELCPLEEVTVDRLAERICLRSCCSRCWQRALRPRGDCWGSCRAVLRGLPSCYISSLLFAFLARPPSGLLHSSLGDMS